MWKRIKYLSLSLMLAFSFLSLPCAPICYANQTYMISESELLTLSEHLTMLEENNKLLQTLLTESDEQSTIALDALMQSRKELETLKAQLLQVQKDAESAKESLKIANLELQKARESFRQSEKERDKIEGRLRNQRNIWEVLCLVAVGVAVAK